MAIKTFPDFSDIDLSLKGEVDRFLADDPVEASEYTFTNIFAFKDMYDFKVSVLNGSLLIFKDKAPISFFCPIGDSRDIGLMFEYMKEKGALPNMERVPESFLEKHIQQDGRYAAVEAREHFDYIYDVGELIDLSGKKFHDKKNMVNRFRNDHKYEYLPLEAGLLQESLEFEGYWCEDRECEKYYGLNNERNAIISMLANFKALGLIGGAIKIDGRVAAITIAERYLPDTLLIHVEKAKMNIPGLYQIINQEFLMHEAGGCSFVNREQDLGIEGLRKAKMSYNPVRFVKKYSVRKA